MTEVNGPVGIWRSVVKHVSCSPLPGLADTLVNPHLLPASQGFRLILRQVGLHGKVGLRQIDGGFQVQRHSVGFSQMIDFFHYREGANERPTRPPTGRIWLAECGRMTASLEPRREPEKHC